MSEWTYIDKPIQIVLPKCPQCRLDMWIEFNKEKFQAVCDHCQTVHPVEWF